MDVSRAAALEASLEYLDSAAALESIAADPYWPKWDSPWWHLSLLHELGLAKLAPERAVRAMAEKIRDYYLPVFPLSASEIPEGVDPVLQTACHCALGNMYQALSAWGLDVDREIPWIRPWFFRYQLPDGGLTCDNEAYLSDPSRSSIVGTIAPLEAVLFHTSRPFTDEEKSFLDRGAQCLIGRGLTRGSHEEERLDEPDWRKPCFPRFYLYDVLRGLHFLVHWAERREQPLSFDAIAEVVRYLQARFPDGNIRNERHCFDGIGSRLRDRVGVWSRGEATFFALLRETSELGRVSPQLTAQWGAVLRTLERLDRKNLCTARSLLEA